MANSEADMAQLSVTVNGRSYRLRCGEGEEERLHELAAFVSAHVGALNNEFGKIGDERLLVMSLLMLADDLLEARDRIAALEKLLPAKQLSRLAQMALSRQALADDDGEPDCSLAELEAELPAQDENEGEPGTVAETVAGAGAETGTGAETGDGNRDEVRDRASHEDAAADEARRTDSTDSNAEALVANEA